MTPTVEGVNRLCKATELQLHRFRVSHGEPAYAVALAAWRKVSVRDVMRAMEGAPDSLDALAQLEAMVASQIELEHAHAPGLATEAGNLLFNAVSEVLSRHSPIGVTGGGPTD